MPIKLNAEEKNVHSSAYPGLDLDQSGGIKKFFFSFQISKIGVGPHHRRVDN
jgi:hypothetical protein